jgi:hypothetical protein
MQRADPLTFMRRKQSHERSHPVEAKAAQEGEPVDALLLVRPQRGAARERERQRRIVGGAAVEQLLQEAAVGRERARLRRVEARRRRRARGERRERDGGAERARGDAAYGRRGVGHAAEERDDRQLDERHHREAERGDELAQHDGAAEARGVGRARREERRSGAQDGGRRSGGVRGGERRGAARGRDRDRAVSVRERGGEGGEERERGGHRGWVERRRKDLEQPCGVDGGLQRVGRGRRRRCAQRLERRRDERPERGQRGRQASARAPRERAQRRLAASPGERGGDGGRVLGRGRGRGGRRAALGLPALAAVGSCSRRRRRLLRVGVQLRRQRGARHRRGVATAEAGEVAHDAVRRARRAPRARERERRERVGGRVLQLGRGLAARGGDERLHDSRHLGRERGSGDDGARERGGGGRARDSVGRSERRGGRRERGRRRGRIGAGRGGYARRERGGGLGRERRAGRRRRQGEARGRGARRERRRLGAQPPAERLRLGQRR